MRSDLSPPRKRRSLKHRRWLQKESKTCVQSSSQSIKESFKSSLSKGIEHFVFGGLSPTLATLFLLKKVAGEFKKPSSEEIQRVMVSKSLPQDQALFCLVIKDVFEKLTLRGMSTLGAIKVMTKALESESVAPDVCELEAEWNSLFTENLSKVPRNRSKLKGLPKSSSKRKKEALPSDLFSNEDTEELKELFSPDAMELDSSLTPPVVTLPQRRTRRRHQDSTSSLKMKKKAG